MKTCLSQSNSLLDTAATADCCCCCKSEAPKKPVRRPHTCLTCNEQVTWRLSQHLYYQHDQKPSGLFVNPRGKYVTKHAKPHPKQRRQNQRAQPSQDSRVRQKLRTAWTALAPLLLLFFAALGFMNVMESRKLSVHEWEK